MSDPAVKSPAPVITFDLEEWFHLLECEAVPGVEGWQGLESRVEASTHRILDLLDRHGIQATFFVLGWIARTHPGLLREIARRGHELGCHSDVHTPVRHQTPEAFREETSRALDSIAEALGQSVTCYRAPGFSITRDCLWAFETLLDLGITADASVFPGGHAHGGTGDLFPGEPFRLVIGDRTLLEFPPSLATLGPWQVAFAGGGYFRLLPLALIDPWTRRHPAVVTYFHPRDFDTGQPRIPGLPPHRRFKAYVGIAGAHAKLDRFLERFGGRSLGAAIRETPWETQPLVHLPAASDGPGAPKDQA